jgi:hypothetical protein
MDFRKIYQKIAEMDGSGMVARDTTSAINGDEFQDEPIEECGDMMPMPMSAPKQSDSVTMNISMNGSGPGGIRDLMSILKDIEGSSKDHYSDYNVPDTDDLEVDIKSMDHPHDEPSHDQEHGEEDGIIFGNDMEEEYANQPDEMYAPVADITPTGNDLHSQGDERPKVNGGGNPYAVTAEGLQRQLQNLYKEVKSR